MKNKLITTALLLGLLLCLLGAYGAPSPARAASTPTPTQKPFAFVVVGQSNAVLMCNPETIITTDADLLDDYRTLASLPTSIASYYGSTNSVTICAAVGGSSIASWQSDASPPSLTPTPTANLTVTATRTATATPLGTPNATPTVRLNYYNSAVKQVRAAETAGYVVKAIILSQGEADAGGSAPGGNPANGPAWATKAAVFLDSFREDIDATYVPVIYTELGATPQPPNGFLNQYTNWEYIRKAQHDLRYNRPNFFMVDKRPFDVYNATQVPYAHNMPASLGDIRDQIMIYLRGWVSSPF